ncbi:MAG: putative colanic acid biosynthesis acetyltransferase [Bacteroides sp.]|nr:putative colanic acid biosynthesis acetyltransferase [Bacteroides sp.]MCM1447174.1 putative colanic acid biosynthesis acetyltransferase [Bacteroides sp.]
MAEVIKYQDSLTMSNKLARLVWNIFSWILFQPFGLPFFNGWRIFVLKLFGAKIGKGCIVHSSAKIWYPKNMILGERVCVGPKVDYYNPAPIDIGDKVTISQGAFLCSASHDISSLNKPLITKPIQIDQYAWICAEALVCLGVHIGEGAVVGARSAVFNEVEPWTVVGGNPAKFIKKRIIKDE